MSILIRPDGDLDMSPLPAVFGLSAVLALRGLTGLDIKIKWPNDSICEGRKICGLLCENCMPGQGFIVAGIGINLLQSAEDFAQNDLPGAASVAMLGGHIPEPRAAALAVADGFDALYGEFVSGGFAPLRARYEELCDTVGRDITVLSPDGTHIVSGRAAGIDHGARLLVETADGIQAMNWGEVSVRGI